jgi:hypothetical protein
MTGFPHSRDLQPFAALFGGLVDWLVVPSMTAQMDYLGLIVQLRETRITELNLSVTD